MNHESMSDHVANTWRNSLLQQQSLSLVRYSRLTCTEDARILDEYKTGVRKPGLVKKMMSAAAKENS